MSERTAQRVCYCPECGYQMRGLAVAESGVVTCPECAAVTAEWRLPVRWIRPGISAAQWTIAVLIGSTAVFVVAYRFLVVNQLNQTAALFVGVPALLAILLTLTPRAKSAVGMTMKGLTIAMLASGIFLGEGLVCILMMAPLFYLVGLAIAIPLEWIGRREGGGKTLRCVVVTPVLVLALEGVAPHLSFPRLQTTSRERLVRASAEDVERALTGTPRFDEPLPLFLLLGFPTPERCDGEGLEIGDVRLVHFDGGRKGSGTLRLRVAERSVGRVVFDIDGDSSIIGEWLAWERVTVRWSVEAGGATRVRWTATYRRLLDPVWYFGPLESFGVARALDYLHDSVSTPGASSGAVRGGDA